MHFVAIDVELANPNMATICQIGVAVFNGGELVGEWSTLIDPEEDFDGIHTRKHGFSARHVAGKPKLPAVADRLRDSLSGRITVCHTHFDRVAISQAFAKYRLDPIATQWLDSAKVARRTWVDLADNGYGLASVCHRIGHEFRHHDALEDAKAAGAVLLAAVRESGRSIEEWLKRVQRPVTTGEKGRGEPLKLEGNPDGELYGEVVVFTGALELPRHEAAALAANAGCRVEPNVTKRTTMLVVGDQDLKLLAGHVKSSKHRKAEDLIRAGLPIRILQESDFQVLMRLA